MPETTPCTGLAEPELEVMMAAPIAADKAQRRITLSSNSAARRDGCSDDSAWRIGEALAASGATSPLQTHVLAVAWLGRGGSLTVGYAIHNPESGSGAFHPLSAARSNGRAKSRQSSMIQSSLSEREIRRRGHTRAGQGPRRWRRLKWPEQILPGGRRTILRCTPTQPTTPER
jgi:hypothetical protein